jgi:hypothetical protein
MQEHAFSTIPRKFGDEKKQPAVVENKRIYSKCVLISPPQVEQTLTWAAVVWFEIGGMYLSSDSANKLSAYLGETSLFILFCLRPASSQFWS